MRVVTLGEIMLRLTPPGVLRLGQAESFEVQYGGAEANVAVALANFGEETSFVSAVPANAVGQAAIDSLRRRGVDTRFVLRGGSRLGIYFLERGVSQRAGGVVYDRADSAFACSEASQYDWEAIFRGADWLHFTGITPALGERAEEVVRQACAVAKKAGATISCDLNFRNKLWDKERAGAVMGELLSFADVCIANEHQVAELFGAKEEDAAAYLADRYPFRAIALSKRRTISATVNVVGGSLYREGKKAASREYQVEMAERIGGGDAFAAGVIYGLRKDFGLQKTAEFAAACCCLKHTVVGDCCLFSAKEAEDLAEGKNSFGVRR